MTSPALELAGRVALVTGATSGIGLEIGRILATRGARVFAGCRSSSRFDAARAACAASAGADAAARWSPARADLAVSAEVDALADELRRSAPPIDLLFLNAGIHDVPYTVTAEGRELTFAANFLGHFRLLHRLAAEGRLAPDARIVVSQSQAVHSNPFTRLDLETVEGKAPSTLRRALWRATASPNTKVLLALAAVEWKQRVAGSALARTTFLGASPGALRTANVDQPGVAMALLRLVAPLLLRPAAEGAELLVWVATAPELAGRNGEVYGRDRRPVRLLAVARDPALALRAWETTERALGLPPFAPGNDQSV